MLITLPGTLLPRFSHDYDLLIVQEAAQMSPPQRSDPTKDLSLISYNSIYHVTLAGFSLSIFIMSPWFFPFIALMTSI